MRVVITGATGNVGTSLLRVLADEDRVTEIVGLARRVPTLQMPKTTWVAADVSRDPLEGVFAGADAVVHLAWLIQPSRDQEKLARVNVDGSRRVFEAAAAAGVGALVYASSIGAYSPGPDDRAVDESWPTDGTPTAWYARHKALTERALDEIEAANPALRVVRLRPGLVFKREAATGIRRLFAGPLLPNALLRPALLKVLPVPEGLRVQAVHSFDLADAYRLAVLDEQARGAYNVAAEPVLDARTIGTALGARVVELPAKVVRAGALASWKAHLQPTPPGWLDMGMSVPIMDCSRARDELGWTPRWSAEEALVDLVEGMSEGAVYATPPLSREASGPGRVRELLTGVGWREP
jgi:UDP-glucose 4-epimerase